MTRAMHIDNLDKTVPLPGRANVRLPPIRSPLNRFVMGIKSPVGKKVTGHTLADTERVALQVKLPQGVSPAWPGYFEYLVRAVAKLKIVLPLTLIIILCCCG